MAPRKPLESLCAPNQSFRGIVCFQALIANFISPDSCIVYFQWLSSILRFAARVPARRTSPLVARDLRETVFLKNDNQPQPVWQEIVA
jgi:hypothetical protein